MDEKLIELVCKCEELHDMSNKQYNDSLERINCGEKWVKSWRNQVSSNVFIAHFEVTLILLPPKL
jgi:hypothetical protein